MKKLLSTNNLMITAAILLAIFYPMAGLAGFAMVGLIGDGQSQTLAQQIKGLNEKRALKLNLMDDLVRIIEKEKRGFTNIEQNSYDDLKSDVERINNELTQLVERQKQDMRSARPLRDNNNFHREEEHEERSISIMKRVKADPEKPITDFILRNYDVDQDLQKADVFRVMRALATGKSLDKATTKALDEVRSVTGTALLNPFLSAQVWDGSLPKTRLAQAGMKVIPLESNEHKFAQESTFPTFEWLAASATSTERTAAFTARTFTPRTLRGWFNVPGEILQDAENIDRALRNMSTKAAAMQIDKAGLIGAGSATEPEGIINYTNLNEYAMGNNGGALTSYAPFAEVLKLIQDDNGLDPNAAIFAPRTANTINQLDDQNYNPLTMPDYLKDIKMFQTSSMPTNEDQGTATGVCSSILFGDFTSLYLGIRMDVMVQVDRVEKEKFEYPFFVGFRGDFLPEREENFGRIKGITV